MAWCGQGEKGGETRPKVYGMGRALVPVTVFLAIKLACGLAKLIWLRGGIARYIFSLINEVWLADRELSCGNLVSGRTKPRSAKLELMYSRILKRVTCRKRAKFITSVRYRVFYTLKILGRVIRIVGINVA